jgi:hypothetical protein
MLRQLRRHWSAVAGALGIVYTAIRTLLDLVGYVDTIIAHWAWGRVMLHLLLAPPPAVTLAVLIVGLALIGWDVHRSRLRVNTGFTLGGAVAAGAASPVSVVISQADTPMSAAIAHVRSAIHDTNVKEYWPAARLALRQRALDGALHIRGRKEMPSVYSTEGRRFRDVHEDIPRDYWRDSQIDICAGSFDPRDMGGGHIRGRTWRKTGTRRTTQRR